MISYREDKNFSYKVETKFVGYGLDAQAIYAKYETKFNIARGIIYNKFIGYCTENGEAYNGFIRR